MDTGCQERSSVPDMARPGSSKLFRVLWHSESFAKSFAKVRRRLAGCVLLKLDVWSSISCGGLGHVGQWDNV